MMNKKLLLILPFVICLSACEAGGKRGAMNCTSVNLNSACYGKNQSHAPTLIINTQVGLVIDHNNVCADRNSTITFNVVPPGKNDIGSVSIVAKNPEDTWLNGTNSPDKKKIEILVPDWVEVETGYEYAIHLSGGACLDPRVEVLK